MSVVQFFLSGANLPFVFVLGVSVLFVLVQWSGVLSLLGGDAEADADGDAEVDVDGDVDADADGDADGDADADADGDADGDDADGDDAEADATPAFKLPLTVRGPIAGAVFALTGLALNAALFADAASLPWLTLAWTLPSGAVLGWATSRGITRLLAPILDDRRAEAPGRKSLVGRIGKVISSGVSKDFGEVRIHDASGHQLRVIVRLADGSQPPKEGDEIVVVDVDEKGTPHVAPLDLRRKAG